MLQHRKKEYKLTDGFLSIDEHLFDGDALVIEGHQIQRVALTDPQRKEYLAVEFDAPLAGICHHRKNRLRLYALNHGMDVVTVKDSTGN